MRKKQNILTDQMRADIWNMRFNQGKGFSEIRDYVLEEYFGGQNQDRLVIMNAVRGTCRSKKEYKNQIDNKQVDHKQGLLQQLKKPSTLLDMVNRTGLSEEGVQKIIAELQEEGHFIRDAAGIYQLSREVFFSGNNEIKKDWRGNKVIKIGIVSDTHIGSIYTQISSLHAMYDIFKKEGVKEVYHAGDIDEGEEMRVGHKYECYIQGADDHVDEICRVYPKREGVKTYFITGNHDHSIIKRVGYNIGKAISNNRKDMEYLNADYARIYLTPNFDIELRHPADGSSYAISYKPQKMVEALGKDTPKMMVVGHYHKKGAFSHRGVEMILAGTFEAQSGFMRNKSLEAHIGGWIIEIHVDDQGNLQEYIPRWFPFEPITDDWKRWRE